MASKHKRVKPNIVQEQTDVSEESQYWTPKLNPSSGKRLGDEFFNTRTCESLAKELLGKVLVRKISDGPLLKGRIVETECYLGGEDKASHSYNNKITDRNRPMFMKPGTIYVYLTYGMYSLLNISSLGEGSAVLLRALEPLEGLQEMKKFRNRPCSKSTKAMRTFKDHELCNGPAKLSISFQIDKSLNTKDLWTSDELWLEDDCFAVTEDDIVRSGRIGIESAGVEWSSKLLRFYLLNNKSVSKRDKQCEGKKFECEKIVKSDC